MEKVRVLAMSDMHGKLPAPEDLPESDIIAIAGDICPMDRETRLEIMLDWLSLDFLQWINQLNTKRVFLVAGNHDFVFFRDKSKKEAVEITESSGKCIYLRDSFEEFMGKIIYGSPWVHGPRGWAFYDPAFTNAENTMPEDVDLAIFHQPIVCNGNGMVHGTFLSENWGLSDFGSATLEEIIKRKSPKHLITGHVHTGNHNYSIMETDHGTCGFCNVSLLNEDYKVAYEPRLIEI